MVKEGKVCWLLLVLCTGHVDYVKRQMYCGVFSLSIQDLISPSVDFSLSLLLLISLSLSLDSGS